MLDALKIVQRRDLIKNLVIRTLKLRYKGSALGFFWTLLNPLAMMVIYYIFIRMLAKQPEEFITSLITGVIFWQFGAMCIGDSAICISGNANLVKKTYFPRLILPLSMVFANLINYLLSLVVLIILLFIISFSKGTIIDFGTIYLLPFILILQLCLVAGLVFIVSSLNVFFRDIAHIVSVVLQALFFMTPVLYPLEWVKERLSGSETLFNIYLLNPFASLVTVFRTAFLGGSSSIPATWAMTVSLILSFVILGAGLHVFKRLEPYFADEL